MAQTGVFQSHSKALCGRNRVAPPSSRLSQLRTRSSPVHGSRIHAAKRIEDLPLFVDPVVGPPSSASPSATPSKPAKLTLDDVPLESEVGIDYSELRDHLKSGDFRLADDETRALLIKLGGEGAQKRNWVYFSEIAFISVKDMQTMDTLWKVASDGKFGYSVQKELWLQNQKRWAKFFKQIDWTQGENNIYRKWPAEFMYSLDAPKGHLPLTNALRGTQLFQAVMEHPAFVKAEKAANIKGTSSSKPLFSL